MDFIVDAQLPIDISDMLNARGHNSIHTTQLPKKNLTSDDEIRILSMHEKRVVITKDSDFFDSFLLRNEPHKLVIVRTGNAKLSELISIFETHFDSIILALEQGGMVELTRLNVKILY